MGGLTPLFREEKWGFEGKENGMGDACRKGHGGGRAD